jgi:hypothetical protein
MTEANVTVVCVESFRELHGGLVWAAFPGLDTVLPSVLAARLEAAGKVKIIAPSEPKSAARPSRLGAEKE